MLPIFPVNFQKRQTSHRSLRTSTEQEVSIIILSYLLSLISVVHFHCKNVLSAASISRLAQEWLTPKCQIIWTTGSFRIADEKLARTLNELEQSFHKNATVPDCFYSSVSFHFEMFVFCISNMMQFCRISLEFVNNGNCNDFCCVSFMCFCSHLIVLFFRIHDVCW